MKGKRGKKKEVDEEQRLRNLRYSNEYHKVRKEALQKGESEDVAKEICEAHL